MTRAPQAGVDAAPSLLRAAPTMIALLAVMACSYGNVDSDLLAHLRFGADILARGHWPTHDIYSYAIAGTPWIDHEWLSDLALAWIYARMGVIGLKLYRFVCAATTIVALAGAVGETAAGLLVQLCAMVLVTAGLMPEMQFRPQALTYALLSIFMWLITRDALGRRSRLWIAIPLTSLWSNLHGGFVVGVGVLGIYSAAVGARDLFEGRGIARVSRLSAIVALAAFASLANPYGIGLWRTTMHTLSRPPMLERIVEWKPLTLAMRAIWNMPHLAPVFDVIIVLVIGGLVLAVAIAPRGGDLPLLVVAAAMIAAAFSAFRNLPLALIGSAAPLALHTSLALDRIRRRVAPSSSSGLAPEAGAGKLSRLTQAAIGLLAVVLAIQTGVFSKEMNSGSPMPVGAVRYMDEHDLHGNVLCDLVWSDYVLYHLWPASHAFVDMRWETVYPERVADDYTNFHLGRPEGAPMLDAYSHDFLLVGAESDGVALADRMPGWKLIYSDNVARLYARAGSKAAQAPGIPVTAQAPPTVFP